MLRARVLVILLGYKTPGVLVPGLMKAKKKPPFQEEKAILTCFTAPALIQFSRRELMVARE